MFNNSKINPIDYASSYGKEGILTPIFFMLFTSSYTVQESPLPTPSFYFYVRKLKPREYSYSLNVTQPKTPSLLPFQLSSYCTTPIGKAQSAHSPPAQISRNGTGKVNHQDVWFLYVYYKALTKLKVLFLVIYFQFVFTKEITKEFKFSKFKSNLH